MATPPKSNFMSKFTLKEILGTGGFSVVYRVVDKASGKEYAAKVVNTKRMTPRDLFFLENEAKICKRLNHPNIVRLHRVFTEDKQQILVFDLVKGGELFDDIVEQRCYTEADALRCMKQILDTVKYIHSMNVVHRDLKPENILLESKKMKTIKITDFGIAVEVKGNEAAWFGSAGSLNYMAPEVLERKPCGKPLDLWSCGVIMYILLAGKQPFNNKDERTLKALIQLGEFDFSDPAWNKITMEAKDLIRKILCVVPHRRLTAAEALSHPWFTAKSLDKVRVNHLEETITNLKEFTAIRKFRAVINSALFAQRTFFTFKKRKWNINVSINTATPSSSSSFLIASGKKK